MHRWEGAMADSSTSHQPHQARAFGHFLVQISI